MDKSKKSVRQTGKKPGLGARSDAPVASARAVKSAKPRLESSVGGDMRVRHREYVRDVAGSVAFGVTSIPVNPGMRPLFPWLAMIAMRFESYRFNSLRFFLNTLAPTSATGSVILAVDYDAADAAPSSKLQAMAYRSSVRGAPWQDLEWQGLGEDLHKLKSNYVRIAALPANLDIKTYDIANLHIITQGQAGTTAVSELYVEYDVTLMTPQIESDDTGSLSMFGNTGLSTTACFGTDCVIDPQSTISASVSAAGDILTFNQDFSGIWVFRAVGTVLATASTVGSTATVTDKVNSVGTNLSTFMATARIVATAGQTLNVQMSTATTFTAAEHSFAFMNPLVNQ